MTNMTDTSIYRMVVAWLLRIDSHVGTVALLMTTPICPRLLNMINEFVLLRFRARTPDDLSAIEVIYLLLLLF